MRSYRVDWAIDVEADSPREAAKLAEAAQVLQATEKDWGRAVFDVTGDDGVIVRVDLAEEEA